MYTRRDGKRADVAGVGDATDVRLPELTILEAACVNFRRN
jgi:hypothetical protein